MLQPCARAYATDMLAAARRKSRARCRSRSGCVSALHALCQRGRRRSSEYKGGGGGLEQTLVVK